MAHLRLNDALKREAKGEMLRIIRDVGPRSIKELQGTPKFHGMRTLSLNQVRSVLSELLEEQLIDVFWMCRGRCYGYNEYTLTKAGREAI